MEITVGLFERHPLEEADSQLIKPHFFNSYTHVNGERDLARYADRITAYIRTLFSLFIRGSSTIHEIRNLSIFKDPTKFRLDIHATQFHAREDRK